jgi:hypothetical protein
MFPRKKKHAYFGGISPLFSDTYVIEIHRNYPLVN